MAATQLEGDMSNGDFGDAIVRAKAESKTTWELIVLPCNFSVSQSQMRACFLCGDSCVTFRDVLCDDIDAWLEEQACLKQHPIHEAMVNMNMHAKSAQFIYNEETPAVLAVCCSCDNYLRGRRGMPFFSPIQAMHWYINTLQDLDGVKMDKRTMFGICKRLVRRHMSKTNYYMSLFSAEEQKTICAMAQQTSKKYIAERELFRHFLHTTKRSCVLKSAGIAHKIRQCAYAKDGLLKPNIYKRSEWDTGGNGKA
jgi:hypothetical protein